MTELDNLRKHLEFTQAKLDTVKDIVKGEFNPYVSNLNIISNSALERLYIVLDIKYQRVIDKLIRT